MALLILQLNKYDVLYDLLYLSDIRLTKIGCFGWYVPFTPWFVSSRETQKSKVHLLEDISYEVIIHLEILLLLVVILIKTKVKATS